MAAERGKVVAGPRYDGHFDAWRYEFADLIDGHSVVFDLALECAHDFEHCPRVVVVTVFYRRGRRKEIRLGDHDVKGTAH